jgi:Ser/Thr protein kinase RdoA (MazF antagonist)
MIYPSQTPESRLNYTGELGPVVDRLCEAYNVGKPSNFFVIGVGYEDCNIIIETNTGKYVAKIFSKERSHEVILRYGEIIEKAVEGGVHHPALIKTSDGQVIYTDRQANGISMVLMNFVQGKTFLELGSAPSEDDRKAVLGEAIKISKLDYHPSYLSDSWAIPNMPVMFERVKEFIQPEDLPLVEKAMAMYKEIPVTDLPHCFVHGDFTKANVMKGDDGKIYILDFSVANWYPRIQELAVIAANLFYDESNDASLRAKTDMLLADYETLNPGVLTPAEKQHMYTYALAAVAMELMGAHQERFINGNATEETEYWLQLGKSGLKKELA